MARATKAKAKAAAAKKSKRQRLPYYNQSTDFTCGAASLLMAMKGLDPETPFDRLHELQVWREANTVYMGKGHAGSSPYGIALAAWRRGFVPEIWLSHKGAILLDYQARDDWRKAGKLVQEADAAEVAELGLPITTRKWGVADLAAARAGGAVPIVLVTTKPFHGDNTPHWLVFAGADDKNVYLNDPWISRDKGQTARTQTGRAASHAAFIDMSKYGKRQERAVVLIRGPHL
ncbi:peptidase C39 family protein [Dongia rigui]|uniref:Peptidase C39 family protein n=1 Tax=Dongia rigui TaxID=940149 RepID=A0ABU5DX96_9PROT|nr:peptidase C39 family protein [Dongia rigui]MDY0871905.1 peptidase C39 family protein [Dongia rigui]